MVLPLVDENKPKCYLCHEGFKNIEELREHQKIKHVDIIESNKSRTVREPSEGDVTVF
tara:strand:- start:802 stop:975 length:174 start_codon:yes stop_codon:yes gene_type:complete